MHYHFDYRYNLTNNIKKIREGVSGEADYDGGSYEAHISSVFFFHISRMHGKFKYLNVYTYLHFG